MITVVGRDMTMLGTKCDSLNQQLDDVQEKMSGHLSITSLILTLLFYL